MKPDALYEYFYMEPVQDGNRQFFFNHGAGNLKLFKKGEMKTIQLKLNQNKTITIESRGAMGLQLNFRMGDDSLIHVERTATNGPADEHSIGGPVPVTFNITATRPGSTVLTFYHTRPWDKDFKEIIADEIVVEVTE